MVKGRAVSKSEHKMFQSVPVDYLDQRMILQNEEDKYFNRRFNFTSIKYKDLVLLSTEELNLGGKNDLKKVVRSMEDLLTLI